MVSLSEPSGISVVIPTMNRAEFLLDTLRDIKAQDFSDYEVIVVDQSDERNIDAEKILASFDVPTRYEYVTHFRGLPEARNFGWRKSLYDIVLYIDDDIRCNPGFLREHFEAHVQTDAAMVAGGIHEEKGNNTQHGGPGSFNHWTATPTRNFHFKDAEWCLHAPGGNFSIRRVILENIGGFDEKLSVGAALYEETELGLRLRAAGYRCWFAPEAHLIHLAAPMGGCRVGPNIEQYTYGMAHNRGILIFRHLKPWYRPTALLRMALYGVSYSRGTGGFGPFWAVLRGISAGRRAARSVKSTIGL